MAVVSFMHYKYLRRIVVMDEPCDRPFHKDDYVLALKEKRCGRCNINVKRQHHPSMDEPRWYG